MKSFTAIGMLFLTLILNACQTQSVVPNPFYNPEAAAYNVQLGLSYLSQGNRQRAKEKLLKGLKQDPGSPSANDAMAYYLEITGDKENARKYYEKAMFLAHGKGASLNDYGAFLCRQGQYEDAEKYFKRAANDPDYINTALAYENAGFCALAKPDKTLAKYYFEKALMQDPGLIRSQKALEELK